MSEAFLPRQAHRSEQLGPMEESVTPIGEPPSPGRRLTLGPTDTIGKALREARLEAGLTTYDISQTTRIRPARLVEIESDDFAGCGSAVLARGRLTAIARAVGVDPGPLLAAFDAQQSHRPPVRVAPELPVLRLGQRNWTAVLLVALGVVALYPLALLVAYVFA